jgi:tellurite resistance protein TerB
MAFCNPAVGKESTMGLLDRVKKFQNRDFMEAVAAACAMVASVDGLVRPEEAAKVVDYAQIDETLSVFDSFEVMETFDAYVRTFEFDYQVGRQKAFEAIRKLTGRREPAQLLVLVAMAVADADGEFDNNQRLAVREICRVVGLSLKEFDLELKAPDPQKLPPSVTAPRRREPPPEWMRDPQKAIERAKAHQRVCEEARKAKEPPVFPVPMPEGDSGKSVAGGRDSKGQGAGESSAHEDSRRDAAGGAQSTQDSKAPSKPETAKGNADLPEWMRNLPEQPVKTRDSGDSLGDSKKKSGTQVPDENLPEWMKNPPVPGESTGRKKDSGGCEEKQKGSSGKVDESLPDWMRNPPLEKPSENLGGNSGKGKKACGSGADLPDWMRNSEGSSKK